MPIAAAIPVVTGIGGALATSSAAKKSAHAVQDANAQSLALQQRMYDQTRSDLQPYDQGGQQALQALTTRLGLGGDANSPNASQASPGQTESAPNALKTGSYADPGAFSYGLGDYTASPAYQVQLNQGINAINSSAAARGALGSGATLKALQTLGSNLALQDYSNERNYAAGRYDADRTFNRGVYTDDRNYDANRYDADRTYNANRYDTQTNNLFNLTQLGQNAAAGTANAGSSYAANASNLFGSSAAAQGNIYGAQANTINSLGQGVNSLAKLYPWPKTGAYSPAPYDPTGT